MTGIINPYRFSAAGASPTFALTDEEHSGDNNSEYTFSAKAIGTATSTRQVIVGISATDNSAMTISAVTIGGSAATQRAVSASTPNSISALYQRTVTSGTTADVVVTFSGAAQSCSVYVYSADGLTSNTPTDTDSAVGSDPIAGSLDVSAGGFAIAVVAAYDATSASWTGLVEDDDTVVDSTRFASAASSSFASAQTGLSVSCNLAGTNSEQSIAMASWR